MLFLLGISLIQKMSKTNRNIKLPCKFSGYFWDCDFRQVDFKTYKELVLERLLGYGRFEALLWVLKKVHIQDVKDFIRSRHVKRIDRKSYLFWRQILKMRDLWELK